MCSDLSRKTYAFLSRAADPLRQAQSLRREQALDFNVFDASGIARSELRHSAFLATLLDPRGPHGQGTLFLQGLVNCLCIKPIQEELASATVRTEYRIDNGRLDIIIRTPTGPPIVIENKIDAREQPDQMSRYRGLSDKKRSRLRVLVFLTPNGDPPSSGDADRLFSYSQLATYLRQCLLHPSCTAVRLREIVGQYADTCDDIGGVVKDKYDDEVMKLLERPAEERLAIELSPYIDALRLRVAKRFWETVRKELDRKLIDAKLDVQWETKIDLESSKHFRGVILLPKNTNPNDKYCVGVHLWAGGSFLAVQRPKKFEEASERALIAGLQRHGYQKSSPHYPGFRYTSCMGLPNLELNDTEGLRCQLDDLAEAGRGHPLAYRISSEIFELLKACLKELERLNRI